MTTRTLRALGILAAGVMLSGPARAALYDRGGGLIYDSALNVTWLQDANYAKTSGYDGDGIMSWYQAVAWADQLSVYDSVRGVTWSDWRLPMVRPINGSTFNYKLRSDGWSDYGYNVAAPGSAYPGATGSELAYMYYINLGNRGRSDTSGNAPQAGWSATANASFVDATDGDRVSFQNLQSMLYWSGTEYAPYPSNAWYFSTLSGYQSSAAKSLITSLYAWALRPGDVAAVPLPPGLWLLGSALAVLGVAGKRG